MPVVEVEFCEVIGEAGAVLGLAAEQARNIDIAHAEHILEVEFADEAASDKADAQPMLGKFNHVRSLILYVHYVGPCV